MTLPDFNELCAYWQKHPPAHLLAAAYLRIGKAGAPQSQAPSDLAELYRETTGKVLPV